MPPPVPEHLDPRVQKLMPLHRQAELAAKICILPAANIAYFFTAFWHPCWQTFMLLATMVGMTVSWLIAFRLSNRGRVETGARLLALSGLFAAIVVMLLREGSGWALTVVLLALVAYTSLFCARWATFVGVASMASVVGAMIIDEVDLIPTFSLGERSRFGMQLGFVVAFFPLVVFFLRCSQKVNDSILREVEQSNTSQGRLLATVARLQPEIDGAVRGIDSVVNKVASQANEQAAASSQVSASTESLSAMVGAASEAAADAKLIAEKTRNDSLCGSRKLQEVEGGFQAAIAFNGSVRTDIEALALEIEHTEAINEAMGAIAEGLKMLSVNAGLEAAKAGEEGRGFAVIATELRRMITKTSEDLGRSSLLLQSIRAKATSLSTRAQANTTALQRHLNDLHDSALLVQSMAESFATAAARIGSITEEGKRQRTRIGEVSCAMHTLDEAAAQLAPATGDLASGMKKLVSANTDLRQLLANKAQTMPLA